MRLFESLELISEIGFCKMEWPVFSLDEKFPAFNFIVFLAPRKTVSAHVFIIIVVLFI